MSEYRPASQDSFVVYWLGGQAHCVASSSVARVIRVPSRWKGRDKRISYEGRDVDVVDLREKLRLQGSGKGHHIMVVKGSKGLLGLIVDRVDAVVRLDRREFSEPSKLLKGLDHLVGVADYAENTMMVTDWTVLVERIMAERAVKEDEQGRLESR